MKKAKEKVSEGENLRLKTIYHDEKEREGERERERERVSERGGEERCQV